mgnify:CR=1 FL=1
MAIGKSIGGGYQVNFERNICIFAIVAFAVIIGAVLAPSCRNTVSGVASAQQPESATTCTALGADTYMIRVNDDRVKSPAKILEAGLKNLLDENPNKKVKSCVPIEQVYVSGVGLGSSTEAIIVVLE